MLDEQGRRYIRRDGRIIYMSLRETRLLSRLIEGKHHTVRYAELVKAVYGKDIAQDIDIERIQNIMVLLREKLGRELVFTLKKYVGYMVTYKEN